MKVMAYLDLKILKYSLILPLLASIFLYTGCATTRLMVKSDVIETTQSDSLSKDFALDHYLTGSVHEESDELYEAAVEYQLALIYNPVEPAVIVALAEVYLKLGEFDAALRTLENGRKAGVIDEELLKMLASFYLQRGMAEPAISCYRDLEKIRPLEELEILRMAALLGSLEKYDDALKLYSEYIDRYGENTEIYYKIGLTYLNLKNIDGAREAFEKLVQLDPAAHRVLFVLGGFAVSKLDWQTAEVYFQQALYADSSDIRYWTNLLMVLDQLDKTDEVLQVSEAAITQFHDFPPFYDMTGGALEKLKRYDEALDMFEKSHELDTTRVAPLLSIGYIHHTLEEWDKAAEAYDGALRINPEHAMVLNNYAYMLSVQNYRLEDALAMSEHALALEPETSSFLDTRGWIYYRMGRYEDALKDVNAALKKGKGNPELYEHLGYIYLALGKSSKSSEAWKKALELDPDNEKYARLVK